MRTESGGQRSPIIATAQAVSVVLDKYEICGDLMYGLERSKWMTGTPAEWLRLLPAGQEQVV